MGWSPRFATLTNMQISRHIGIFRLDWCTDDNWKWRHFNCYYTPIFIIPEKRGSLTFGVQPSSFYLVFNWAKSCLYPQLGRVPSLCGHSCQLRVFWWSSWKTTGYGFVLGPTYTATQRFYAGSVVLQCCWITRFAIILIQYNPALSNTNLEYVLYSPNCLWNRLVIKTIRKCIIYCKRKVSDTKDNTDRAHADHRAASHTEINRNWARAVEGLPICLDFLRENPHSINKWRKWECSLVNKFQTHMKTDVHAVFCSTTYNKR